MIAALFRRLTSPCWTLTLLMLAAVSLPACEGCDKTNVPPPAMGCTLNSQCTAPLVCGLERCHSQCQETRDCPAKERCVLTTTTGPTGNVHVCQVQTEARCLYHSDCKAPLVCAVDGQCRNQCYSERDCTKGQICTPESKVCAEPAEITIASELAPSVDTPDAGRGPLTAGQGVIADGGIPTAPNDAAQGGSDGGASDAPGTGADQAVAPDVGGAQAATGGYLYVGGGTTIAIYALDASTGALTSRGTAAAGDSATLAVLEATGKYLYVVSNVAAKPTLLVYAVEPSDGTLRRIGQADAIAGITEVQVHPQQAWFAASSSGAANALFPIGSDGKLGASQELVMGKLYYHFLWDPTGKYLFAAGSSPTSGARIIDQYSFDSATGMSTPSATPTVNLSAGHAVGQLQLHETGKWAYSLPDRGAANYDLGLFTYDAATGTLTEQEYQGSPDPMSAFVPVSLALPAGGQFLFVFERENGNLSRQAIATYSINQVTGRLTYVRREMGTEMRYLRNVGQNTTLLGRGGFVFLAGQLHDAGTASGYGVVTYRVNPADGSLTEAGMPAKLPTAVIPYFVIARPPQP